MHKITANVEVHGIAGLRPVLALLTDMLAKSVDAVVSATAYDTRIRVGNKGAFKELMRVYEV